MNNIEKIRQEIERRKKSLRAGICNDKAFTKKQKEEMLVASEELTRLSCFIDSLPEEFPPYCTGAKGDPDPAGTSDLEEAAKGYASKTLCDPDDGPSTGLAKESFIAGAEWQKEHKPAEWSEEEKAIINDCINRICVPDKYIDHSNDARSIAFLESLLNGLRIKGIKGPSCDPGRRGRMGGVPKEISKEAEAFQAQFPAPYDKDDIITAYETAKIKAMEDLPKWKEVKNCGKRECFVGSAFEATGRRYLVLYCYGYGISIEQLFEKLPKEDK